MRILFSFAGGSGHANPMVPIARAAGRRGHAVAFAGRRSATGILEEQGFSVFPDPSGDRTPAAITPLAELDLQHEYRVLRTHFAGRLAGSRVPRVLEVSTEWRPDVVVCDEVDFGGMVAAERLGLPHATVLVTASSFVLSAGLAEPLDVLRTKHGLPPDDGLAMPGRDLVLSPFPPSLRGPADLPGERAFAFRDDGVGGERVRSAGPTVYFTLGTEFNSESGDLFSRVLLGLRELPLDVIVTVGRDLDPAVLGPQPERIRVERYVPQSSLLPSCDLVINHGGSGSVIGALAYGRPMIVIPMGADQAPNAARCGELGVAVVLDAIRLTPASVRNAVENVLADGTYRAAAERVREEIARLPSADAAVPLLEKLVEQEPTRTF